MDMGGILAGALTLPLFIILACVFLSGNGAGLIAGYNTMPLEKKRKYDEKAMCRFVGKMMLGLALASGLWLLSGILGLLWLFFTGLGLLFLVVVVGIIYMNTEGRFQK